MVYSFINLIIGDFRVTVYLICSEMSTTEISAFLAYSLLPFSYFFEHVYSLNK